MCHESTNLAPQRTCILGVSPCRKRFQCKTRRWKLIPRQQFPPKQRKQFSVIGEWEQFSVIELLVEQQSFEFVEYLELGLESFDIGFVDFEQHVRTCMGGARKEREKACAHGGFTWRVNLSAARASAVYSNGKRRRISRVESVWVRVWRRHIRNSGDGHRCTIFDHWACDVSLAQKSGIG